MTRDETANSNENVPTPDNQIPHIQIPRRGTANPELIENEYWRSVIRTHLKLNSEDRPCHTQVNRAGSVIHPRWSFYRFGQTKTTLANGTVVYIAGEHEDYYDPDFYIYNDVVTVTKEGEVTTYGYSEAVFPPTDFHTATLVNDKIFIVGCLGYPEQRQYSETPVFVLNLTDFSIESVATYGLKPNWLFKHSAEYCG